MTKTILSLMVLTSLLPLAAPAADPPSELERRLAVDLAFNDWDAQQKAAKFLDTHRAHREAIVSLQQCRACHGGGAPDKFVVSALPDAPWIGVSVGPADGILRAQLRLPEGSGVVVTQVVPNGPAQQAGVEKDDVLLSVNGKPVGSGEDLDKALQSATPGGAPLTLKLLHAGETVEKQVVAAKADPQGLVSTFLLPGRTVYRIGVLATEADAVLRRQLKLGDTGLVISEVQGDKPADKAGVKAGDVLLSVNGKQVAKEGELTGEILRSDGKPVELGLVRGGARL